MLNVSVHGPTETNGTKSSARQISVFLVCTGVGIMNRGIETFARECFDGLHGRDELDLKLYKGAGPNARDEHRLWTLPRTGNLANLIGRIVGRNGYVVEQLAFFPSLVYHIRRQRPDLIFYSDANLGFQLYRWRKQIGVPFRLLFSNGAPMEGPFNRTDFVQQVTPVYRQRAIANGASPNMHIQVPYGINVPDGPPLIDPDAKRAVRKRLDLPVCPSIVLSVGWISARHKRMDYVVREIASLPKPRPHLVMLGHMDDTNTPPILRLAEEKLGAEGFTARSVPYQEVVNYYHAAEVFALGSVREGFGRVYMEALMHGLPCVVHDGPVMRYVLGDHGTYANLRNEGEMASALLQELRYSGNEKMKMHRREFVRNRFGWESLASQYIDMFRQCLSKQIPA